MPATPRDELYEGVAIDAAGTMTDADGNDIQFTATGRRDAAVHIDASEAASFGVDVGVRRDDGSVRWFEDARTYGSTATVSDQWTHAEQLLRLTVTTAGGAGATADVYVSLV